MEERSGFLLLISRADAGLTIAWISCSESVIEDSSGK